MLQARDIMNAEPPFCELDTSIQDIAKRFANESVSGMLVVDEEKRLLGVITESDLIDQQAKLHVPTVMAVFDMVIPLGADKFEHELSRMQALVAEDLMTTEVKTIQVDTSLAEIASMMGEDDVHHLPVLEDNTVVGLISRREIIQALSGQLVV